MAKASKQKGRKADAFQVRVFIVGPLKLQNELLGWYLENTTGFSCECFKDLDARALPQPPKGCRPVIMLDCLSGDIKDFWAKIRVQLNANLQSYYLALFNVSAGQRIDNRIVNGGIRGVFFSNDPLYMLSKGAQAIARGELWYSRETLMQCLQDARHSAALSAGASDGPASLTAREQQILLMIASGVTNGDIADQLSISPHTVKTHVYNIYAKINVPNRLQAALWAAKHL